MTATNYLKIVAVTILFAAGILHWLCFYNFGNLAFNAYDWPKEISYYSVIQQALVQRSIPYHISQAFQQTDRFLAIPETLLSPQALLLPFMKTGTFAVFNTLFMYTLGFWGCLLLRKRYNLTWLPFLALYLLFNFNGYITSHLAVGHSMWNGYFLLPFFFLLVLKLIEGRESQAGMIPEFSFLLFLLLLQGSLHIFIWCLFFLAFLALFNRRLSGSICLVILFSILLSCFRLLPAMLTFYKKGYPFVFISGYPAVRDFLNALVTLRLPGYLAFKSPMGWWEFDVYFSFIGLLFIIYFGIYLRFSKNAHITNYKFRELDFPILLMTLLSLNPFYSLVAGLPIPFLNSQRYSSRFFIIPLLALLIISCLRFNQTLAGFKKNKIFDLCAACGLSGLAIFLARHSWLWRIENIERQFGKSEVPFSARIAVKADPQYISCVNISATVSLVAILGLTFFYLAKKGKIFPSRN